MDCFTEPVWKFENLYMETQGNFQAFRDFYEKDKHVHY